ncbi:GOLGI SNARE BET1-RELATED [Salix viminalis]|uniref:GOLGI SNARE BET1-RELATED n=1 Tax=Salix viminalis TaxID=40686 RepID=A0A9Q0UU40_SALVM|nr:GOLGI SNARE BET1-RELATED [Salix viminalis]
MDECLRFQHERKTSDLCFLDFDDIYHRHLVASLFGKASHAYEAMPWDIRNNRAVLFDGIEEGGIRASSSYSSHEIDEQDNERALEGLQDRVIMLKRLSGDINEEVDNHNLMLDRMGNDMDSSRGVLSGTMDRFKMVFETKSSRRMFTLVASFVVLFLIIYYLTRLNPRHALCKDVSMS